MLKFEEKTVSIRNKDYKLIPFMVPQKPQNVSVPPLLDLNSRLVNIQVEIGETMKHSMNSMILGSFVINFIVSISMKKLLQAVRIFQIIAFFILLPISFSAEAKLLM